MRRLYLFLAIQIIALAISANNYSDTVLEKAIEKADSFYTCLKTISQEKQGKNVAQIKFDLLEKYFEFPSEQNAPNEFNELGLPNDYKHGISVYRYVNFFADMFNDETFCKMSFDYAILRNKCSVLKGPEVHEDNTIVRIAKIVVRKTYSLQDTAFMTFSDTLIFNLDNMKIYQWTNDAQKLDKGNQAQIMLEPLNNGIKYGYCKNINFVQNYIGMEKREREL